jgi:hypothetical protein
LNEFLSHWGLLVVYGWLLLVGASGPYLAWRRYRPSPDFLLKMARIEQRQIAATSLSAGAGAAMTGASIALGVVGGACPKVS